MSIRVQCFKLTCLALLGNGTLAMWPQYADTPSDSRIAPGEGGGQRTPTMGPAGAGKKAEGRPVVAYGGIVEDTHTQVTPPL